MAFTILRGLIGLLVFCVSGMLVCAQGQTYSGGGETSLRDPTTPLTYRSKAISTRKIFVLQAVYTNGTQARAIINGELYRQGEVVSGWTLVLVGAKGITLKKSGETMHIQLLSNVAKVTAHTIKP